MAWRHTFRLSWLVNNGIQQSSSTNSLTGRDFCWRNMICFFITPTSKSKQTGTQLCCWRECGGIMVDHAHECCCCPSNQTFWKEGGSDNNLDNSGLRTPFQCTIQIPFSWTYTWRAKLRWCFPPKDLVGSKQKGHNKILASEIMPYCWPLCQFC